MLLCIQILKRLKYFISNLEKNIKNLNEQFEEKFENLNDQLVALIADNIKVVQLRIAALENDIKNLREDFTINDKTDSISKKVSGTSST